MIQYFVQKKHVVIEEYFDLLFNEDTVTTGVRRVHHRRLPDSIMESSMVKRADMSKSSLPRTSGPQSQRKSQLQSDKHSLRDSHSPLRVSLLDGSENGSAATSAQNMHATINDSVQNHSDHDESLAEKAFGDFNSFMGSTPVDVEEVSNLQITSAVAAKPKGPDAPDLTFTEFLRVNMRLAEDRVLSFVLVFCTGFGTKWVPGATFYYSPEVSFQTLLTQRRRWINGTVASYFYFFTSQRARLRVQGGFFVSIICYTALSKTVGTIFFSVLRQSK